MNNRQEQEARILQLLEHTRIRHVDPTSVPGSRPVKQL